MLNFADRDMKTKSKTSKDMFYRNQRRIVLFFLFFFGLLAGEFLPQRSVASCGRSVC